MRIFWMMVLCALAVHGQNRQAYVIDRTTATVYVVDILPAPDYGAIIGSLNISAHGASPWQMAFTPDGSYAYIGNTASSNVTVLQTTSGAPSFVTTVGVGSVPYQIAFAPSGTSAFVCNNLDSTVTVLNTSNPASPSSIHTINVATDGGSGPIGICVNNTGSQILVACQNGSVLFYSASSPWNHLQTITLSTIDYFISTNSNQTTAYIPAGNNVVFVDLNSRTQVATFSPAGAISGNAAIAISPDNSTGWTYNSGKTSMYLFDALTGAQLSPGQFSLSIEPFGLVFSPDGSVVYATNDTNGAVDVYSSSNPFSKVGSISGFTASDFLGTIVIKPNPSSTSEAAALASAQIATQQNINNFESSLQNIQNQAMQVGILNIANGTYADTVTPSIIDASTPFVNLVPIIPVWCGQ
jgi:DNA-binding beta-propeller fold protein YncE